MCFIAASGLGANLRHCYILLLISGGVFYQVFMHVSDQGNKAVKPVVPSCKK
jgi:hypothetical protein